MTRFISLANVGNPDKKNRVSIDRGSWIIDRGEGSGEVLWFGVL